MISMVSKTIVAHVPGLGLIYVGCSPLEPERTDMLTGVSMSADNRRIEERVVTGMADRDAYNYKYFDQHVAEGDHEKDEAAFRSCFHAGETAKDFVLPRLDDGAAVRLSSLWKSKPLVMEFGSFT
jgi:hypothetical protein